jgi:hypothetical protein
MHLQIPDCDAPECDVDALKANKDEKIIMLKEGALQMFRGRIGSAVPLEFQIVKATKCTLETIRRMYSAGAWLS